MKKIAIVLSIILFMSPLMLASTPAKAANITYGKYGFTYDASTLSFDFTYPTQYINYYYNGKIFTQATINVGIGTVNSNSNEHILAVRSQITPYDVPKINDSKRYYHAVLDEGFIGMTLLSDRSELHDFLPDSTTPTSDEATSFGVQLGYGKEGANIAGTLGVSVGYQKGAFTIHAKAAPYSMGASITYDYEPVSNIWGRAAHKKINTFLNDTHKEYAIFSFTDHPDNKVRNNNYQISLSISTKIRVAQSKSPEWDGGTIDFTTPNTLLKLLQMREYIINY